MKSPFPGMDPWIEHPSIWPDVHQRMITYTCDALQARVGPSYFVAIGERVYLEAPAGPDFYPDVSVVEAQERAAKIPAPSPAETDQPTVLMLEPIERREVYLEIRDAATSQRVVTVLEVLSPSNKRPGTGRDLYLAKQREILSSTASLIEIDLLRAGESTVAAPASSASSTHYRIVVSPSADRRRRELYPIRLRERLPRIAVPLLPGEGSVALDVQAVFGEAYSKGAYTKRIDYASTPVPALAPDDLAWARERIASRVK